MSRLAINGGTPVRTKPWSHWPPSGDGERKALLEVLESLAWGGFPEPQPMARKLGEQFAAWQDARYGIACANGSISLEIALWAGDIHAGDEVIVPVTTWIATAACAVRCNAVPVFADIDPNNYCIDPDAVEAAITPRTKAIIPVHLGSSIADLDRLVEIARKHNLLLIEDCAHAHGSRWRGKGVGSYGDFGSFSFQSSKILTSGEGGLVTANDSILAQKVHSLVNCGRKDTGYEDFPGSVFGFNARITEFQAGVMLAQLDRAESLIQRKADNAAYLTQELAKVGGLTPVPVDPRETRRGIYQLVMTYDADQFQGLHRDRFLAALEAEGIELDGPFYLPIPHNPLFQPTTQDWPMLKERYGEGFKDPATRRGLRFRNAERFALDTGVWMHYPYLLGTHKDVDDIVAAVAKIKEHAGELK